MTFSQSIAALRKAHGLTQAELAARLGVDKQSISNWECGRNTPWPRDQEAYLKALQDAAPGGGYTTGEYLALPLPGRPSISERILKT